MFYKKQFRRLEDWLMNLDNFCKRDEWNRINRLEKKLNLILDHLNLEYVPETEKKEPAKLVEKKKTSVHDAIFDAFVLPHLRAQLEEQPKKKRGRPKKK